MVDTAFEMAGHGLSWSLQVAEGFAIINTKKGKT
jgi:hypothetical protein